MSLAGRLFAGVYDRMFAATEKAGLSAHREALVGAASGRVLEIGAGTGANLPFYEGIDALVVTEPEAPMARRLERRLAERAGPTELVHAPAEELPFEDASFDTAVSTLVLCTVGDQARALAELRRVLKPDGRLLFIEHVRSADPGLARWQDRINGLHRIMGHGCNCNRSTLAAIESAGFTIASVDHDRLLNVPPTLSPLVVGTATPTAI